MVFAVEGGEAYFSASPLFHPQPFASSVLDTLYFYNNDVEDCYHHCRQRGEACSHFEVKSGEQLCLLYRKLSSSETAGNINRFLRLDNMDCTARSSYSIDNFGAAEARSGFFVRWTKNSFI